MLYIYILESILTGKHYIGYTSDWRTRLDYHNRGANRSTRPYKPYKVVYLEQFDTKRDALVRERQLKSYKGGEAFKQLITSWSGGVVNRIRL